jgi:hypothetical protein
MSHPLPEVGANAPGKKPDSERTRLALDLQLKRADVELRRLEIAERRREGSFVESAAASPLVLAICGGIITAVGGIAVNQYQAGRALELERQKHQHELIVKMITTDDLDQAAQNLRFLVRANLLEDPDGQIAALADDPKSVPLLSGGATLRDLSRNVAELSWLPYQDLPIALQGILARSEMKSKPALKGRALYDALDSGQRSRLLILYSKMARVDISGDRRLADFVLILSDLGSDRVWAYVDQALQQEIQKARGFAKTSDALHRAPDGYIKTGSYRTLEDWGSLQIVFYASADGGKLLAEIDVD